MGDRRAIGLSSLLVVLAAGCSPGGTIYPCHGIDCSGHGKCLVFEGAARCECDDGFVEASGLRCVAEQGSPCEGVPCPEHASCQVEDDQGVCVCDSGYHPEGEACVADADPCAGVDCGVNAHCEEGVCVCDAGFEGDPLTACREYGSEEERIRQKLVDIATAELGMCEGSDERPYMEHQPGYWCYDCVMSLSTTDASVEYYGTLEDFFQ